MTETESGLSRAMARVWGAVHRERIDVVICRDAGSGEWGLWRKPSDSDGPAPLETYASVAALCRALGE